MTAYTTTTTKSSGQGLSSAEWNALANNDLHFSEILNWAPTITQSATVSKTVNEGWYGLAGTRGDAQCKLTMSSAGTASNPIILTLPVTVANPSNSCIGTFTLVDASDSNRIWQGACLTQSTTTFALAINNTTNVAGTAAGGFTGTLATGDIVTVDIKFRAA